MRILFATWAWGSHYYPMVPLAWAAAAAGHDVRIASAPAFSEAIVRSGLPAVEIGKDVDVPALMRERKAGAISRPGDASREQRAKEGISIFADVAERMADDLVAFGRAWRPDLVVFEPTTFAAPLLAQVLGVPSVRHLWTVDFTRDIDLFEEELLGPLARKFGLDRVRALGDLTVDPCPPRLQAPKAVPRQPIRYVPYNGPATVPGWLNTPPDRDRVCVTWGTSLARMGLGADTFRVPALLEVLAEQPVEVVVTLVEEQRALLKTVPGNVKIVDPVALNLLFPTCTAVVHQGGGGTMMTAAVHGLRQLAVPQLPDQMLNARTLAGTGAGAMVSGLDFDPESFGRELSRVLEDDAVGAQAAALAGEMADRPGAFEVVSTLERLNLEE